MVLDGTAAVKHLDTQHFGYRSWVASKPPTIRQVRYRLLLEQLSGEERDRGGGGKVAQAAVAKKVGVSQTLVSQILRGVKNAGEPSIDTARRRLRIRAEFFTDESLGETPRYSDHIEIERVVEDDETKHALDDLMRTWPEAARWRPEIGEPPSELEQAWLQSYSFREDRRRGLTVDADLLRSRLLDRRRQMRGRAIERPRIEAPRREDVIRVDDPRRK